MAKRPIRKGHKAHVHASSTPPHFYWGVVTPAGTRSLPDEVGSSSHQSRRKELSETNLAQGATGG